MPAIGSPGSERVQRLSFNRFVETPMSDKQQPRYAIYAVPPTDSPLWKFGSAILGYDAVSSKAVPRPKSMDASENDWNKWTSAARTYGFHGTLKAPFRLRSSKDSMLTEANLLAAIHAFAAVKKPISIGRLELCTLKSFVALTPLAQPPELTGFAADCVTAFETFRAPLTAEEISRRNPAELTVRQSEYLAVWGYPYVFEEYRYHMTLTGSLHGGSLKTAYQAIALEFAGIDELFVLDRIAVFRQSARDQPFVNVKTFRLGTA